MSRPIHGLANVARSALRTGPRRSGSAALNLQRGTQVTASQASPSSSSPPSRPYSTNPHPSKPPKQGQPLSSTHPHLVHPKYLTAGIPASEYEDRRRKLMEGLGEGAKVVCMGNTVRLVTQRESHVRVRLPACYSVLVFLLCALADLCLEILYVSLA